MELNNRGMTLIELVTAMVITTIVTGAAYGLYGYFMKTIQKSQRFSQSEQGCYRKLEMVTSQLRRAQSVLSLAADSLQYIDSRGDTISLSYQSDTLYRIKSDEQNPWFTVDSLSFSSGSDSTGWNAITIQCGYPGQMKEFHFLKRTVTCYIEAQTTSEESWGFW